MADASSQIGYLIRGGLLLDLNGALDAAVDIRAVPSSRDEMIAHNFAKRFQATTQEDNGAQCFNAAKKKTSEVIFKQLVMKKELHVLPLAELMLAKAL